MSAINQPQGTVVVDLGSLLDAGDGAVVTLIAGETRLAAHKAVLEARSPVFEAMFRHDMLEASSGQVSIADVEGPVLRQMLAYCYTLQAPQLPDMARQLLAAADKYGLSALKAVCEQQVVAQLAIENAAASAVVAVRHSCPDLTLAAISFIKAHIFQVLATQGWADAMRDHLEDVTQVTRLLGDLPAEATTPAIAGGRITTGTPHQPHSDPGGQTPATAIAPTAPHHNPQPEEVAISRLRSLPNEERDRLLIQAAKEGAVEDLQALLISGADVRATDEDKRTALHWAAYEGHVEAARLLLEGGAEVDARNIRQHTPLHSAASAGQAAVVRLLLASAADPNVRNMSGYTPLHWAACLGRAEAAAALLEAGANRWVSNDEGKNPRQLARENNHQQLVELLT